MIHEICGTSPFLPTPLACLSSRISTNHVGEVQHKDGDGDDEEHDIVVQILHGL
jgi:hypothetical protein